MSGANSMRPLTSLRSRKTPERARSLQAVLLTVFLLFSLPAFAGGDEIELKTGEVIRGDVVARNDSEIYLGVAGGKARKIKLSDIKSIYFGPKAPDGAAAGDTGSSK